LTGTCYSDCFYNRYLNLGFVISSNSNNDHAAIWNLVISYLEQDKPDILLKEIPLNRKAIKPFLGYYQFESPRNEISGFKDKLLGLTLISFKNHKLIFKQISGEAMELIQTAPNTFAFKGANTSQIIFTTNSEGKKCMINHGGYHEQTYSFTAIFYRCSILLAIILCLSFYLLGIISIVMFFIQKTTRPDSIFRILPMLGLSLLASAFYYLLEVEKYTYTMYELGSINHKTILIFFGTLSFGIISLINFVYSIRNFKRNNGWLRYYLLFSAFSMCYITCILGENGWIGLRTWAL